MRVPLRRGALAAALLTAAKIAPLQAQVGASSDAAAPSRADAAETSGLAGPRLAGENARTKAFVGLSASVSALRETLVERARANLGTKYVLGGISPESGFDCSGLVQFIVGALDIKLPRTAQEQARLGRAIPRDREQMKPGDLLTFGTKSRISHIGIYVGEGRFVHASTSKRQVIESTLDQTRSSLVRQWQGVRRLVDSGTVAARRDSVLEMLSVTFPAVR